MAGLALPAVFDGGMVLQRERVNWVWGRAAAGQTVRVCIAGREARAAADAAGRWRARLAPMPAGGPHELTVAAGDERVVVRDVLVGEVWLLSGQSNMAMTVEALAEEETAAAVDGADLPALRLFRSWGEAGKGWRRSNAENAAGYSGVGQFFGSKLHGQLDAPVGLILAARGGTMIQSFISERGMRSDPLIRAHYLTPWEDYRRRFDELRREMEARPADARVELMDPADPNRPGGFFAEEIEPLIPYTLRGVVWYQGESDAWGFPIAEHYGRMLRALMGDWRGRWRDPSMYFVICQLPNNKPRDGGELDVDTPWARVQEAQAEAARGVNAGLAVGVDTEAESIHPKRKMALAHRAAAVALADVYGRDVPARGPTPRSLTVRDGEAIVRFDHAEGLRARGGGVVGVAVAGADRRFFGADARIEGRALIASSDRVAEPAAVRYAFSQHSPCCLYNGSGLPAPPFRTDDWTWDLASGEGVPEIAASPSVDVKPADLAMRIEHTCAEAPASTRLAASWDRRALRLEMRMMNAGGRPAANAAEGRDDARIWAGDHVEIVLDADPDDGFYHRFAVAPNGAVYDARGFFDRGIERQIMALNLLEAYRELDASWDADWSAWAEAGADGWAARFEIPWEAVGLNAPVPGRALRMQVARRFGDEGPVAVWADAGRGRSTGAMLPRHAQGGFQRFHQPERFGILRLGE